MRIPLAILAMFCGVLMIAGAFTSKGDRLRITTRDTPFTVVVTLPDVTESYRWLSVYGCSAAVYEHGTFCTGDFERESTQETRSDQQQYPFPWANRPRGTLLIIAAAFDAAGKPLARGETKVFR